MIDQASVPSLMGSTVRDSAGDKIGKVGQVYLDDTTGQPEWVTVRTGLFGTKESFVPLAAARVEGDELVVDILKSRVHDAPKVDEDGHLSEEQENELYAYYGVSQGPFGRQTPTDAGPAAGTDDYLGTDRPTGVAPTGLPADYDATGGRMSDVDTGYDTTGRGTAAADPTGTPIGDTDVSEAFSGPGFGEQSGPGPVEDAGPDFARGTDGSVTGEPSPDTPDFARGTDAESGLAPGSKAPVRGEPSPRGPDFARGTDAETGLATGRAGTDAGSGLAPGEAGTDTGSGLAPGQAGTDTGSGLAPGPAGTDAGTGGARRRLRRWQVTDEVAGGDLVDERGDVVGEVRAERVEITPDDDVPPGR
jgi:sporulation protein YlmC with PRC-barrel domain